MVRPGPAVHRRRARGRHARTGVRRVRRRVLPRPLDRHQRRFRRDRSNRRAQRRDAADAAGLRRIVYLGGMGRGDALSTHLASRHQVGEILASGRTPTTELRAAVIIGSGSISFEMLRYLTEVLPALVTPRWVRTKCQPIAIRDVLLYLAGVLEDPETRSRARDRRSRRGHLRRDDADLRPGRGTPPALIVPVPLLAPSSRPGGSGWSPRSPHGSPSPDRFASLEVVMADHEIDRSCPTSPSVSGSPSSSPSAHPRRGDRHTVDRHRVHSSRHHPRGSRVGRRFALRRPSDGPGTRRGRAVRSIRPHRR